MFEGFFLFFYEQPAYVNLAKMAPYLAKLASERVFSVIDGSPLQCELCLRDLSSPSALYAQH